jgi:hypothetical protein
MITDTGKITVITGQLEIKFYPVLFFLLWLCCLEDYWIGYSIVYIYYDGFENIMV